MAQNAIETNKTNTEDEKNQYLNTLNRGKRDIHKSAII